MYRLMVGCMLCAIALLLNVPAYAGQPGLPPGQNKLPAPENVVCPVVDGLVEVSWDEVEGAHSYQVEYVGLSAQLPAVEETLPPVFSPPVSIDLTPFGAFISRVRALDAPKHPGNPLESGKKGDWSAICVVLLEPTPL
jgi:hypothetical protein